MDLTDCQVVLTFLLAQNAVGTQKRIIRAESHLAPANQVHDEQAVALAIIDAPATSWLLGRVIGRTQDVRAVVQIRDNLTFIVNVVAQRDDIGTGIKNVICLIGCDTHARSILAVYDGEIDGMLLFERAQQPSERIKAGFGDHVPNR